jgi:hypothetical protein
MEAFFPDVPPAVWVVRGGPDDTSLVLFSMSNTSRLNGILVAFSIVLIVVFVVLTWRQLAAGGQWHPVLHPAAVARRHLARSGHHRRDHRVLLVHRLRRDHDVHRRGQGRRHRAARDHAHPAHRRGDLLPRRMVRAVRFPTMEGFSEDALENSALPEIAELIGGNALQGIPHRCGLRRDRRVGPGVARVGLADALSSWAAMGTVRSRGPSPMCTRGSGRRRCGALRRNGVVASDPAQPRLRRGADQLRCVDGVHLSSTSR